MSTPYDDLRTGCETAIAAIPSVPSIVLSNKPAFRKGDPTRLIVLSWRDDEIEPDCFEEQIDARYEVRVTIFDQENYQFGNPPETLLALRIEIRQALYGLISSGSTTPWDWAIRMGKVLDKENEGGGYWQSTIVASYTVLETGT